MPSKKKPLAEQHTRGRPAAQDAAQRELGRIPASEAATLADRHISRLYRARESGRLPMVSVGGYWYVERADLARAFTIPEPA